MGRTAAEVKVSGMSAKGSSAKQRAIAGKLDPPESVRVSPNGYFAALFLFSLTAGFLSYLQQTQAAL
ncbi:MAG TPA: hypothetical protein VEX64_07205, partial [Pyrinomonadaceae bacterium]|nr:hypothetical protein [Pyrinomonadaceae bacterium]